MHESSHSYMQTLSDQAEGAQKQKQRQTGEGFCYPLNVTGCQDKTLSIRDCFMEQVLLLLTKEKASLDPKHCTDFASKY